MERWLTALCPSPPRGDVLSPPAAPPALCTTLAAAAAVAGEFCCCCCCLPLFSALNSMLLTKLITPLAAATLASRWLLLRSRVPARRVDPVCGLPTAAGTVQGVSALAPSLLARIIARMACGLGVTSPAAPQVFAEVGSVQVVGREGDAMPPLGNRVLVVGQLTSVGRLSGWMWNGLVGISGQVDSISTTAWLGSPVC